MNLTKILVVEDTTWVAEVIKNTLENTNKFLCDLAENGEEAIKLFQLNKYELMITDLSMPEMNGYELIKLLRPNNIDFSIIAITAIGNLREGWKAIELGAVDCLFKPFENRQIILCVQKVLDQMALKREQQRLDKLKEDLTNMIVHDMRTPLNVIMGSIDFLKRLLTDNKYKKYFDNMSISANQLSNMCESLLYISKFEKGNLTLDLKKCNLTGLVKECYNLFSSLFEREKKKLLTILPKEDICIEAEENIIKRVIQNLMSNALKHTSKGDEVTLILEKDSQYIKFSVKDTGPGISKKYQERIFDKFFQIEETTQKRGGVGLGLAFCKMMIDAHRGKIYVESEINKGSTFCFHLPI